MTSKITDLTAPAFDPIGDMQATERRKLVREVAQSWFKNEAGEGLYTCIGKGGIYELVGVATGAGSSRLSPPLTVYRDVATGALYFRTAEDFAERMQPTKA